MLEQGGFLGLDGRKKVTSLFSTGEGVRGEKRKRAAEDEGDEDDD